LSWRFVKVVGFGWCFEARSDGGGGLVAMMRDVANVGLGLFE
jgi:hypothetical protein